MHTCRVSECTVANINSELRSDDLTTTIIINNNTRYENAADSAVLRATDIIYQRTGSDVTIIQSECLEIQI